MKILTSCQFQVGTRVTLRDHPELGPGTIIYKAEGRCGYLIEFDMVIPTGHNGDHRGKDNCCWFFAKGELVPLHLTNLPDEKGTGMTNKEKAQRLRKFLNYIENSRHFNGKLINHPWSFESYKKTNEILGLSGGPYESWKSFLNIYLIDPQKIQGSKFFGLSKYQLIKELTKRIKKLEMSQAQRRVI